MAYYRRRRTYQRRARRPVFGKKATRAILAIAQKPVETKTYRMDRRLDTTLTNSGYVAGESWAVRSNIFENIPRADTVGQSTEHEVIGNELMARGFWISINLLSAVAFNANQLAVDCRITVYSVADQETTAPTFEGVSLSDPIFESDFATNSYFTAIPFNTQKINVLKSHKFSANFIGGNGNFSKEYRMWVPITGRKISSEEEVSGGSNNTFGVLKGRNYYWLMELFSPGASNLGTQFFGNLQSTVYFKDA